MNPVLEDEGPAGSARPDMVVDALRMVVRRSRAPSRSQSRVVRSGSFNGAPTSFPLLYSLYAPGLREMGYGGIGGGGRLLSGWREEVWDEKTRCPSLIVGPNDSSGGLQLPQAPQRGRQGVDGRAGWMEGGWEGGKVIGRKGSGCWAPGGKKGVGGRSAGYIYFWVWQCGTVKGGAWRRGVR